MKNILFAFLFTFYIWSTLWLTKIGAIQWLDMSDMDEPDLKDGNMGGFAVTAYILFAKDIDSEAELPASPATLAESVTLSGSHTMVTDATAYKVYVTQETLNMMAESQGELDAKSFKITGEGLYPSTSAEARGFAKKINNAKALLIAIDPNTGVRYQAGSKKLPLNFSPSVSFGQAYADRRGVTFAFEGSSPTPVVNYEGTIPLSSGDLPAVS